MLPPTNQIRLADRAKPAAVRDGRWQTACVRLRLCLPPRTCSTVPPPQSPHIAATDGEDVERHIGSGMGPREPGSRRRRGHHPMLQMVETEPPLHQNDDLPVQNQPGWDLEPGGLDQIREGIREVRAIPRPEPDRPVRANLETAAVAVPLRLEGQSATRTPSGVNLPTTMASGRVTGPITAPITPSVSSLRLTLTQPRSAGTYRDATLLITKPSTPITVSVANHSLAVP